MPLPKRQVNNAKAEKRLSRIESDIAGLSGISAMIQSLERQVAEMMNQESEPMTFIDDTTSEGDSGY
jgi:hypothetical protein